MNFVNIDITLNRNGKYDLDFKNPQSDPSTYLESSKLAELYQEFIKEFPMVSIEDPFDQDDWDAWTSLTANTTIQVNISLVLSDETIADISLTFFRLSVTI